MSGWNSDLRGQHPRPIRNLSPAGSPFFYEWPDGIGDEQKRQIIYNYWFETVTKGTTENYRNAGFGRM